MQELHCSRNTANFLCESWQDGTKSCYNPYIKKWFTFCLIKGYDKYNATEAQVCAFLQSLSEAAYSYGAVNTARCALSVVLPKGKNGETMGKRYWVSRACRSAYLRNPPRPKYTYFWDVKIVFRCIKNFGRNSKMSLAKLGRKVLVLLLLVSGQRGQVARALSLDHMTSWDDGSITFNLLYPMKTARTGEKLAQLKLEPYHREPKLCVIRALKRYLERTEKLRKSRLLFVSYVKPHEDVSRDTISRWVLHVMRVSGVNTNRFGPHSLRGAGVSSGARLGISTDLLLKYGSWKGKTTMARHYQKPILAEPTDTLGARLLDDMAE